MEQLDCLFDLEYSLNCIRAEEREEGREEGGKFKTVETVKNMLARGYDYGEIADIANINRQQVEEIASSNVLV